ncbi:MAG: hypothetical protein IOMNBAOH_02831 [Rhodocyclaceae bacterium]|nr:hypothetical protein [Rhodocyclaceae bacterium]
MHKPFHDVLHPPELQGRDRRRYWIAVAGWFVFMLAAVSFLGVIELMVAKELDRQYGPSFMSTAFNLGDEWLLAITLFTGVLGIFLGDYLWGKVFVKSGYLSPAAAIRIRTNRAPTARGERAHRRLSLSLSVLIPLGIAGLGVYTGQYWLIPFMLILGLWLFISIRAGWQQADDMMAGQAPYPEDEVKRVLHDIDPPPRDGEDRP